MLNHRLWKNWNLSTRIGIVISMGIIVNILVVLIGASVFLKKEHIATFGKQQFTTVQDFALYLDADLASKLKILKVVADLVPPEIMLDVAPAQQFLSHHTGILSLFDDGLMIISADGHLLAETPFVTTERLESNYSSLPFFQQARDAGRPIISEPFLSVKPGQRPIIEFINPIYDGKGEISGYLCGGLTLTGDNVLGNIAKSKVGEDGYFYLYSQDKILLIHPDATRLMKKDPPPKANTFFNQVLQGVNGSGATTSRDDSAFMSSFYHLQVTPWILAADIPMQEVMTPFYGSLRLILLTILLCGLLTLLCVWWSLFRFIAPLHRFIAHMDQCDGRETFAEYDNSPELARLTTIFNQMLARMKESQDSISKLSVAVEQSPVTIVITDTLGNIEFVNPAFTRLTGYTFEEALGKNPRLLKTEKNLPETYVQLWQTISNGKIWEGELYNIKKNGEEFTEHAIISPIFNDKGEITHYMAIKEDITARKQSEEIIWRQANFDHLTGLPNRRLFLYRLQSAMTSVQRDLSSLVLLFLDLDHFKEVNDTLGHDYGDLLLIEAAHRIQACVRDTDTVSRFGGDEFILILTNIKLEVGIDKVTKKILEALQKPYYLNNQEVTCISASIGVTTCPEDATDISTLLKNADLAMYLAKAAGRNCCRSFADVREADRQKEKEHHVEI
jgi:diguanylate cyclase (GGDEF)-like protein/PAS domain S-box-containing protein